MNNMPFEQLAETAIMASIEAGKKIIEIYNSDDFEIEIKSDNSPLTRADLASNNEIKKFLDPTNIPLLSEEGRKIGYAERKNWETFWMIDPLDGTKEFIKRNREFTVNIALIENNSPVMGIIYTPATDELFFSVPQKGAFKMINAMQQTQDRSIREIISLSTKIQVALPKDKLLAVGSRSHMSDETLNYLDKIKTNYHSSEILSKGSSLKLCLIAEGKANIYPRFAPTMEWDIAAGHAIIKEAGGVVLQNENFEDLNYNKENLLNPWFIASCSREII